MQSLTTLYRVPWKLFKEKVNAVEDVSNDLWHTQAFNIFAKKKILLVKGTPVKTCTMGFLVRNTKFCS